MKPIECIDKVLTSGGCPNIKFERNKIFMQVK